jgi:predicted  nucleic acid-binding Zn-ribbon protein
MPSATIDALLELWTIDQRRRELRRGRDGRRQGIAKIEQEAAAADTAAATAKGEADRLDALIRQYQTDAGRCEARIAELRSQQTGAKTNKDYMAIINGIEQAKAEKAQREQSVKEISARKQELVDKAAKAAEAAALVHQRLDKARGEAGSDQPGDEEQALDARYAESRGKVPGEFLEVYERLVKANHKSPMVRVDPRTRATPFGVLLSHNQVEQIRQGKLVIDRNSNAILYIAE